MSAIISLCGRYRYRLERVGRGEGQTAVIMVNPSTADAESDDHTIRKLRGFGERYGWGRIVVGNLFAFRATDVRDLSTVDDPIGPENDDHLRTILAHSNRVIFAWGPVAKQPKVWRGLRWRRVQALCGDLQPMCLGGAAKDGHPRHPLMLSYDCAPQWWEAPR